MKALKFELKGKSAFYKKTDVNKNVFFTYSHIHKVALLGLLGSIIGLDGYSKQYETKQKHPEFYEKLKNLKISIVPKSENDGYFDKKIITFNNATGLASNEEGGILNIKEQWLINVCWDIYILDDNSEEYLQLKKYLLTKKSKYIPYLGKNDHFADITNVQEIILTIPMEIKYIHSLCMDNVEVELNSFSYNFNEPVRYFEYLPYELDKNNLYKFKLFTFTNLELKAEKYNDIYTDQDKNLMFF